MKQRCAILLQLCYVHPFQLNIDKDILTASEFSVPVLRTIQNIVIKGTDTLVGNMGWTSPFVRNQELHESNGFII